MQPPYHDLAAWHWDGATHTPRKRPITHMQQEPKTACPSPVSSHASKTSKDRDATDGVSLVTRNVPSTLGGKKTIGQLHSTWSLLFMRLLLRSLEANALCSSACTLWPPSCVYLIASPYLPGSYFARLPGYQQGCLQPCLGLLHSSLATYVVVLSPTRLLWHDYYSSCGPRSTYRSL